MFKAGISSLLKEIVTTVGLLPWWEEKITPWPRVLLHHHVDTQKLPFLGDLSLEKDIFLKQLSRLKSRYRFLTWPEYKEALLSPREAIRSILLTFDDGFRSSWSIMSELAAEQAIPSLFFVNTRVLDNGYVPWTVQYYFLRSQNDGTLLKPLWKSISNGVPLSPAAARPRLHECFSLSRVVEPIAEGLAQFGITAAELAQKFDLYISSADIQKRHGLLEIGNHSHSHYVLSKLSEAEVQIDLQTSHQVLEQLLQKDPESFAYPFGIPGLHFNVRCRQALRNLSSYPYIFSASDDNARQKLNADDLGRACFDQVEVEASAATAAKVTPRALKNWLFS